jgi:cell division initiation protein
MIKEAEIKASQILEKARENTNEVRTAVINLREEKNLINCKIKIDRNISGSSSGG